MDLSETVESFKLLVRGWDSYGAYPPHPQCIEIAAGIAPTLDSSKWSVCPTPRAGIVFESTDEVLEIEINGPLELTTPDE